MESARVEERKGGKAKVQGAQLRISAAAQERRCSGSQPRKSAAAAESISVGAQLPRSARAKQLRYEEPLLCRCPARSETASNPRKQALATQDIVYEALL